MSSCISIVLFNIILALSKILAPTLTIAEHTGDSQEVFCLRFSPDSKYVATGLGDGTIKVYNTTSGHLAYTLNSDNQAKLPTTSIRFRPEGSRAKTKNVLLSVDSDGFIKHWHLTSGKCLSTITDQENPLLCVDYRSDGEVFAAAGKDYKVRIYDESSKALISTLAGGYGKSSPGHSNRVFSLKFHPTDKNVLISGGWDNTVQIWDLRVEESVQSFYGPHISGDSVDIRDNKILTGSWRPDEQLQIWDYPSGKLIETVPWFQSAYKGEPCLLYTAQFSKGKDCLFAAGGSGSNETKIFDHDNKNELIGTISGLTRGVFSLDFSPTDPTLLAIGGGDSAVRIFSIQKK